MIVYAANGTKRTIALASLYPGRVGRIVTPPHWRTPTPGLPYALDNGAFGAYVNKTVWEPEPFMVLLEKARSERIKPEWVVVPDVHRNKEQTLYQWSKWAPIIKKMRFNLAFAVQDGMTEDDVPEDADVVFVGGSPEWKWITVGIWATEFSRVHVGKVNTENGLWRLHNLEIESCDGSGWMRHPANTMKPLEEYLARTDAGLGPVQGRLFWL